MPAAGVLCWRNRAGGMQVLLVRGARHGEWSWPKGHQRAGESLPECAVRETLEETGLRVTLGAALPGSGYLLPDGRPKRVSYWAARVGGPDQREGPDPADRPDPPDPTEITDLAWVPARLAADLLPHAEHHLPLAELLALAERGRLDSRPLLVLRHASARSRHAWGGAEPDRPLSGRGRRQAQRLPGLLACWRPTRLVSSPWLRCTDTLDPYAALAGLTVLTDRGLSETGHRKSPEIAAARLELLLGGDQPALICTHRPVLGTLAAAVEGHATPGVAAALPAGDPYLRPAEVLVAQVVPDPDGRHGGWGGWAVTAVEQHRIGGG